MQHLFQLERGLARFEIDDEANADAGRRRKLRLPQLLRLAFAMNDQSERLAIKLPSGTLLRFEVICKAIIPYQE